MKKENTLILLSFFVFLYCLARAVGLSMTHDESATVLEFASRPFWKVVTNDPARANNHLLNTVLIQFFMLFGNDKLLIRLPNLLAAGLFLYFSYRLVMAIAKGWWEQLLLLAVVFHFLNRANVKTVQEWWFERFTEDAFEYIAAQQPRESTIRMGSFWLFTPTLSYYKQARGYLNIIGPSHDYEVPNSKYFDYYYLSTWDTVKLHPDYVLEKSFGDYCIMKLPPDKKEMQ